jgi:hypothetical protein
VAALVYRVALGRAGNCGVAVAVRAGAWLRAQRRPGLARLYARLLSAPQETIRRGVSGRCVRVALVFYLKRTCNTMIIQYTVQVTTTISLQYTVPVICNTNTVQDNNNNKTL